jgi:predicted RNase H-like nuclease
MTGKGLSILSWSLKAKILEAEDLCSRHNDVIEAHPEVSFRAIKGTALEFSKKAWNGQDDRRRLLELVGIRILDVLPGKSGKVPPDDILDAAAAAWTAHRFALGQAKSLPAKPVEGSGTIWY